MLQVAVHQVHMLIISPKITQSGQGTEEVRLVSISYCTCALCSSTRLLLLGEWGGGMWRSEDNFVEFALSCHLYMDPGDGMQVLAGLHIKDFSILSKVES